MIIEDYTPVYFETIKRQPTPLVYEGKFVHVAGPREEFLLLAPTQMCKYHAQIVAHFSSLRDDVRFVLASDDGHFKTPGWSTRGGGRFRLDRAGRHLWLWGASKAYGAFEGGAIREELRTVTDLEGYEVRVEEPK